MDWTKEKEQNRKAESPVKNPQMEGPETISKIFVRHPQALCSMCAGPCFCLVADASDIYHYIAYDLRSFTVS